VTAGHTITAANDGTSLCVSLLSCPYVVSCDVVTDHRKSQNLCTADAIKVKQSRYRPVVTQRIPGS